MPSHLGIDIGTTSVKVCVVRDQVSLGAAKKVHKAKTSDTTNHPSVHLFDEQNPYQILQALHDCICEIQHLIQDVSEISITGQMHGVLLWKRNQDTNSVCQLLDIISVYEKLVVGNTNLITWQDKRCSVDFLKKLPSSPPFCKISTGFGIATLAWMNEEYKNLDQYDFCGTIMDFVAWLLCPTECVTMTSHNANSWGYYDLEKQDWEMEKVETVALDRRLIPKVAPVSDSVGHLKWPLYGMKEKPIIYAAYGDMQCSISATCASKNEAVLHIGTSSQLSLIVQFDEKIIKDIIEKHPGVSVVPYKGEEVILSAASLSGGNAFHQFATTLHSWMEELNCDNIPCVADMLKQLELLASMESKKKDSPKLAINPRFNGERFEPNSTGSVTNITNSNCSLGNITLSLYKGVIRNLFEMLPISILKQYGVDTLIFTGGAFEGNDVLKELLRDTCDLELRHCKESNDASFGAAIFNY